jgi:hypothetical protein
MVHCFFLFTGHNPKCPGIDKFDFSILLVCLVLDLSLIEMLFFKVEGSERLEEGDYASQVSRFLEGYRPGKQ